MRRRYGWLITEDHLAKADPKNNQTSIGVMGPRDVTQQHAYGLRAGGGVPFKMFDDDGELYYEGRIVGDFDGLEPLDDFGTPDAGCTTIHLFRNGLDQPPEVLP